MSIAPAPSGYLFCWESHSYGRGSAMLWIILIILIVILLGGFGYSRYR